MKKHNYNSEDIKFLRKTVDIAIGGIAKGGGPFGAVIVRNGKIIAETYNRVVLTNDPTAHAEVLAIREASAAQGSHDLSGCTLYASCEPCPMCLGAIYWAGIDKVFYVSGREDASKAGFGDGEFYNEICRDPEERKIIFTRVSEAGGEEVFRAWEMNDERKSY